MSVEPNHESDEGAPGDGETIRTSEGGIHLRKTASMFNDEAVAIDLTIRSDRSEPCVVEVTEELPDGVRDNHVEFHPHYDPDHWSHETDRVVYRAPVGPGVVRRTVYGVSVDDPNQLDAFTTVPTVEVDEQVDPSAMESPDDSAGPPDGETFGFEEAEPSAPPDGTDARPATDPAPARSSVDGEPVDPSADAPPAEDDVVAALVAEIQRRDLTDTEQSVLTEALGLDEGHTEQWASAEALGDLQADLEAIREDVAAIDRPEAAADRFEDRLEAVSTELESLADSLTADLEALRADLEEEVRWRAQFRQTVVLAPDEQ